MNEMKVGSKIPVVNASTGETTSTLKVVSIDDKNIAQLVDEEGNITVENLNIVYGRH